MGRKGLDEKDECRATAERTQLSSASFFRFELPHHPVLLYFLQHSSRIASHFSAFHSAIFLAQNMVFRDKYFPLSSAAQCNLVRHPAMYTVIFKLIAPLYKIDRSVQEGL